MEGEKWFNWIVEASNDQSTWKILHTGVNDMLGYETKFYNVSIESTKYLYYRFFGVLGETGSPRLSYMQIYSLDYITN